MFANFIGYGCLFFIVIQQKGRNSTLRKQSKHSNTIMQSEACRLVKEDLSEVVLAFNPAKHYRIDFNVWPFFVFIHIRIYIRNTYIKSLNATTVKRRTNTRRWLHCLFSSSRSFINSFEFQIHQPIIRFSGRDRHRQRLCMLV